MVFCFVGCISILYARAHLPHSAYIPSLFPHHQNSNITIRTQLSAGATEPCYISLILYEQPSATITPENPVIGYQEQYYDDRILGLDFGGFMVLLSGTPGGDQTEAMGRLLERVEVLVRAGWTAGS